MSKILQFKRYSTADLANITGAVGELIVDLTKDVLTVHDGVVAGGHPMAKEVHQHQISDIIPSGTYIPTSYMGSGGADASKYLRGDGTWATIPSGSTNLSITKSSTTNIIESSTGNGVTLDSATTSVAGLMSAADKNLLNTLSANSGGSDYVLPVATSTVLGGVRVRLDATTSTLYIRTDGQNA